MILRRIRVMFAFYVIGIVSATFHFCNGCGRSWLAGELQLDRARNAFHLYLDGVVRCDDRYVYYVINCIYRSAISASSRSAYGEIREGEQIVANSKVIVVGGGLAGLMATIKAAEAGVHVQLFSLVPVKRSHSVCAQGGINGAVNTKGEGDSTLGAL